ncbi:hypothetical protein H310_00616 [Aphanomyces invadans]|uniref:Uncharacterized protein n=1 Tax=Aphanomyces invadans TaxID=157072 RepID=A0A024UWE6_9STRA|nr:hypothetical protein H310_00616 [Aphanomyces invadans]ETW10267.1 hypothetical protein H310_00616 [Aphanomyces invadans]RHY30825.1 hypothetical protein DYB32_003994 [Aphanomyces invadans]|eukprot:XP_008861678.1 hypothetical protein H310_00616 [Aphanomyces invadans]
MASLALEGGGDDPDCWPSMHLPSDSDIAIIRALLRWGEFKCQRSLEHIKSLDLPLVNGMLSATASMAGRIGLHNWVDSIIQYCGPLTASIDKFLAHQLLSTLAFALDEQSRHTESGRVRGMEERIQELEHHVEELHSMLLDEVRSKNQLSQELNHAQMMTNDASSIAGKLEEELELLQRTLLERQEAITKGLNNEIADLEEQLDASNRQCERLHRENIALEAKLKQTEQKLMWSMLFLTVRTHHGVKAIRSYTAKA